MALGRHAQRQLRKLRWQRQQAKLAHDVQGIMRNTPQGKGSVKQAGKGLRKWIKGKQYKGRTLVKRNP